MWRVIVVTGANTQPWLHKQQQPILHYCGLRRGRTMMMMAATSRQKRALEKAQLEGSSKEGSAARPTAVAAPPRPSSSSSASTLGGPPQPPPPSSGGGGPSSSLPALLVGAAAALAGGGGAYLYYNDMIPGYSSAPTSKETPTKEATTEKGVAPVAATPAADTKQDDDQQGLIISRGNRVTQIAVVESMMNKSVATAATATPSEPPPHPANGNRVPVDLALLKTSTTSSSSSSSSSSIPDKEDEDEESYFYSSSSSKKKRRKKKKKSDDEISSTKSALERLQRSETELAAQALLQSHQVLWTSLDAAFFSDLDHLSTSQLKARVVQLAMEMKDRTQWEAVRLKEFLALKEKETAQKYIELIQKQRLEYEDILATRLREQEAAFHKQLRETLEQKEASIKAVVDAALDAQQEEHDQDKEAFSAKCKAETEIKLNKHYGEQMEAYKKMVEKDLQQKVATLNKLSNTLGKLEAALEASQRDQQGSSKAHKLSAAALALSEVLETHFPAAKEVQALQTAAGPDGVIATAVRTLPLSVQSKGVPTLSELQAKFEDNYSTCRQAALVPPGRPGLDGQLAGMVFAALKYPPQPDDVAPEDDPNNAEYVLSRARRFVQWGELSAAVDELEKLQGQVAFVIQDWKQAALDRLAVDKAMKVIKLECALLHENQAK